MPSRLLTILPVLLTLTACIQPTAPAWTNPMDDRDNDGVVARLDCDDLNPLVGQEVCARCGDTRHTGGNCDVCLPLYTGAGCGTCVDPLRTGEKCEQCLDVLKTGAKCEQCVDVLKTGAKCDQCVDALKTGSKCEQCVDVLKTGSKCEQCVDVLKTGAKCDHCVDVLKTGAKCDQCVDVLKTGAKCDQCVDALKTGAKCEQCLDANKTGATCDGCKNALACDDGNACTNDSCASAACQHVNNTAGCDDGNACTTGDACSAGVCKGTASCGNGVCDCGESNASCVADCPSSSTAQMVLIPAGTFWMGCNPAKDSNCASDESPQHKVTLSAYYMNLTETTVAQYKACVDAGACTVPSSVQPAQSATYPGLTTNPVNFVSWTQSQAYCKWRGAAFDLPTEAQWEMAARGSCELNGSTAGDAGCAAAMRTYPWGGTAPSVSYAVFSVAVTATVGSKPAGDSPYGLHDMAGNVWEWNRDGYGPYGAGAMTDPVGPGGASARVLRGGGFYAGAVYLRAGSRYDVTPSYAATDLGLRCIRTSP